MNTSPMSVFPIVYGDLGPPLTIALTADGQALLVDPDDDAALLGDPFVLNASTDMVSFNYVDNQGVTRTIALPILAASSGVVQHAWQAGDLPAPGLFRGQAVLARSGDSSFPRTFPDDGTTITIAVAKSLGSGITPGVPIVGAAYYPLAPQGGDPLPPGFPDYLWLNESGQVELRSGGSSSPIGGNVQAVEPDPFGSGSNMPAGRIDNYTDANLASSGTIIRWKGADNQGTVLTGINSTGVAIGTRKLFWNRPNLGLNDVGGVTFTHRDSNSSVGNQFDLPHESEFYVAPGQAIELLYNDQGYWTPIGATNWSKILSGQALHAYPPMLVGVVSGAISGTVHDWNPTGDPIQSTPYGIDGASLAFQDYSMILVNVGSAGLIVEGLFTVTPEATSASNFSPLKWIVNVGSGPMVLRNQDSNSTTQNQLLLPGNVDLVLMPFESASFTFTYFNGGQARWQCIGTTRTGGDVAVTPSALPSIPTVTDNWAPGTATRIRVTPGTNGSYLGGIVGMLGVDNASCGYGERRTIQNIGGAPLFLVHQSAGSSTGNKFFCPNGRSYTLMPQESVEIIKDDSNQWYVLAQHRSPPLSITTVTTLGNNWSPVDDVTGLPFRYAKTIRVASSAGGITGLDSTGIASGDRFVLTNWTGGNMTIANQSGSSATANQVITPGQATYTLASFHTVGIYYDGNAGAWILEGP